MRQEGWWLLGAVAVVLWLANRKPAPAQPAAGASSPVPVPANPALNAAPQGFDVGISDPSYAE